MSKFRVRLVATAEVHAIITVEAQSSADAYDVAVESAKDGEASWQHNGVDNNTIEATGIYHDILNYEERPPDKINLSNLSVTALKLLVANITSLTDEQLARYYWLPGGMNESLVGVLIRDEQRKREEHK